MQVHAIQPTILNRYIIRQLSRFGTEGQEGFNHLLLKGVSYMMFALMPLFAFIHIYASSKKSKALHRNTGVFYPLSQFCFSIIDAFFCYGSNCRYVNNIYYSDCCISTIPPLGVKTCLRGFFPSNVNENNGHRSFTDCFYGLLIYTDGVCCTDAILIFSRV